MDVECLLLESTHHTHQLRYQIVVVVDDDDGVYLRFMFRCRWKTCAHKWLSRRWFVSVNCTPTSRNTWTLYVTLAVDDGLQQCFSNVVC